MGVWLDVAIDWDEVADIVREKYRTVAPRRLWVGIAGGSQAEPRLREMMAGGLGHRAGRRDRSPCDPARNSPSAHASPEARGLGQDTA